MRAPSSTWPLRSTRPWKKDSQRGHYVVLVSEHKRQIDGPAVITLTENLMDIYINKFRPQLSGPSADHIFLNNSGEPFLTRRMSIHLVDFWNKSSVRPDLHVTATNIWKWIVTVCHQNGHRAASQKAPSPKTNGEEGRGLCLPPASQGAADSPRGPPRRHQHIPHIRLGAKLCSIPYHKQASGMGRTRDAAPLPVICRATATSEQRRSDFLFQNKPELKAILANKTFEQCFNKIKNMRRKAQHWTLSQLSELKFKVFSYLKAKFCSIWNGRVDTRSHHMFLLKLQAFLFIKRCCLMKKVR